MGSGVGPGMGPGVGREVGPGDVDVVGGGCRIIGLSACVRREGKEGGGRKLGSEDTVKGAFL